MKKISHLSTISSITLLAFIVPQIAFAAWWNPISWFSGWNIFHRTDTKTQVLENRVKELEKKLENTASSTPVTTTTKAIVPIKTKVTETPAPKKVSPVVVPVQTVVPVQPATVSADSQLLMIEKCKAAKDTARGTLWPAYLKEVTEIELQKAQKAKESFIASSPDDPVTILISSSMSFGPSYASHQQALQLAQSFMEERLAKEYSACLNRN